MSSPPGRQAGWKVLVISSVMIGSSWLPMMPARAGEIVVLLAFPVIACAWRLFWLARHLGRNR
jgi:hypothetical protein